MIDKVAVVTGSNKGIGFGIVRELCKRGVKTVYLTARHEGRGRKAVSDLHAEDLHPKFHILDVSDVSSIKKFAAYLKTTHGGVDILINNVGSNQHLFKNFDHPYMSQVVDANYRSVLRVVKEFFPILKQNARVLNMSSVWGHIFFLKNPHWVKVLSKEDITVDDVESFVGWYLDSVKNKSLTDKDFLSETCNGYKTAKIAICAVTKAFQLMMKEDKRNISINSVHPGDVRTDSSGDMGFMSIEESAITPVYIALDVEQSVKGKFFWYDKDEVDWTKPMTCLHKVGIPSYINYNIALYVKKEPLCLHRK